MHTLLLLLALALLPISASAETALPPVQAKVHQVDRSAGTLTLRLKHVPNLDLPPMTMVLHVADPAMLKGLNPEDKLNVTIDKVGNDYTVMSIEPRRE